MQNTSIFIKNGTQNLENLQLFCTFANETPQQGKNTAQAVKQIGENNKFNLIENYVQFSKKIEVYR